MEYTVKNVKTFKGTDGPGFSATLYRDEIKIASVLDEGDGGDMSFMWDRPAEAGLFKEYCETQPPMPMEGHDPLPMTTDIMVGRLVDNYTALAEQRRWCKGKIVFRLKGDKEGQWRTLKGVYSKPVDNILKDKFGDTLEEILNKRFV